MVSAPASHQCGAGSNPGVDAICELSLLSFGSLPCYERFFSWYSGLPLSLTTNTSTGVVDDENCEDELP